MRRSGKCLESFDDCVCKKKVNKHSNMQNNMKSSGVSLAPALSLIIIIHANLLVCCIQTMCDSQYLHLKQFVCDIRVCYRECAILDMQENQDWLCIKIKNFVCTTNCETDFREEVAKLEKGRDIIVSGGS